MCIIELWVYKLVNVDLSGCWVGFFCCPRAENCWQKNKEPYCIWRLKLPLGLMMRSQNWPWSIVTSLSPSFSKNCIYFFLAMLGLRYCSGFSSVREWGLLCGCGAQVSQCGGFFCCGAWALKHRLSSCGSWAYLLCSMWNLPGAGIPSMSPALAGGFFTTEPPGKPWKWKC